MKNAFLTFVIILFSTSHNYAQEHNVISRADADKGFYLRIGTGYAFPRAGETFNLWDGIYSGSSTYPQSSSNYTFNADKASFAAGLRGYLALGYMFNKNIGVELGADLGMANKKYTYSGVNVSVDSSTGDIENQNVTYKAHFQFIVNPSIVMQTSGDAWKIYTRFGLALPLMSSVDIDEQHIYLSGSTVSRLYDFTESLTTKFSMGFTGAAGVSYGTSENMRLWCEVSAVSMSLYANAVHLTAATYNGTNIINNISPATIPFGSSGGASSQYMTFAMAYSNVAVNIGIAYKFPHQDHSKGRYVTPRQYRRD